MCFLSYLKNKSKAYILKKIYMYFSYTKDARLVLKIIFYKRVYKKFVSHGAMIHNLEHPKLRPLCRPVFTIARRTFSSWLEHELELCWDIVVRLGCSAGMPIFWSLSLCVELSLSQYVVVVVVNKR